MISEKRGRSINGSPLAGDWSPSLRLSRLPLLQQLAHPQLSEARSEQIPGAGGAKQGSGGGDPEHPEHRHAAKQPLFLSKRNEYADDESAGTETAEADRRHAAQARIQLIELLGANIHREFSALQIEQDLRQLHRQIAGEGLDAQQGSHQSALQLRGIVSVEEELPRIGEGEL